MPKILDASLVNDGFQRPTKIELMRKGISCRPGATTRTDPAHRSESVGRVVSADTFPTVGRRFRIWIPARLWTRSRRDVSLAARLIRMDARIGGRSSAEEAARRDLMRAGLLGPS